jgi:peptidyl-tRNA hydrolase, PTH1 family
MSWWKRSRDLEVGENLRLIVGLGNPGPEYARTRHNIGFVVLEALASRHDLRLRSSKHRALLVRGSLDGTDAVLACPLTFMNESGNAVSRIMSYYRIPVDKLLVVCDDIDLPFGTLRIRPEGSSGGQRGLQSIIQTIGTDEFARIRIGLGRPSGEAVNHVLSPFPAPQQRLIPALAGAACDAIASILNDGVAVAMNVYNRDWLAQIEA